MGKNLSLLLLLITLPLVGLQRESEVELSTWARVGTNHRYKAPNGKMWREMSTQEKIFLLTGLESGVVSMEQNVITLLPASEDIVHEAAQSLMIKGFRMSDIAEQLDLFYGDSANLRVPVIEAYRWALLKMKGAPPGKLSAYEAELRARFNQ